MPPRSAMCLAGQMRALLHDDQVGAHFKAVVLDVLQPDIFVHASAEYSRCMTINGTRAEFVWRAPRGGLLHAVMPRPGQMHAPALAPAGSRDCDGWFPVETSRVARLRTLLNGSGRLRSWLLQPDRELLPTHLRVRTNKSAKTSSAVPCSVAYENVPRAALIVRWAGCMKGIEAEERRTARRYEYILQSRPDLRWECSPSLDSLLRPGLVAVDQDYLFIAPRDVGGHLLRMSAFSPCVPSCNHRPQCLDHVVSLSRARLWEASSTYLSLKKSARGARKHIATIWRQLAHLEGAGLGATLTYSLYPSRPPATCSHAASGRAPTTLEPIQADWLSTR